MTLPLFAPVAALGAPDFSQFGLVTEGDRRSWAAFSSDRTYRYLLGRIWGEGPMLLWLLTNPSKAGGFTSDQTVIVAREFTRRAGYGGMIFANLKALVETDARKVEKAAAAGVDIVGPANRDCIEWALLQTTGQVVVAWGANGSALGLDVALLKRLRVAGLEPLCLGITKDGFPRHPLRLAYSTPLVPYCHPVAP